MESKILPYWLSEWLTDWLTDGRTEEFYPPPRKHVAWGIKKWTSQHIVILDHYLVIEEVYYLFITRSYFVITK